MRPVWALLPFTRLWLNFITLVGRAAEQQADAAESKKSICFCGLKP